MKKNILILIGACLFSVSVDAQAQVDRSKMPKTGPTPQINLGKPQTFELKNGLKVLVVENHKLPRVSATLTIDNMPHIEGDKAGVSDLTGALLGSGTKSISKDDFNKKVDFLGANLSFWESGARMGTLSKYFNEVLGLMADGAINPVFTQEDFKQNQDQILEGMKSEGKSVKAIAGKMQNALTYGKDHPYGEFSTEESVASVSVEDVKNYYGMYFRPNNAYLVVVGDVKFKDVKKKVKNLFSKWEKGTVPATPLVATKNASKTEIDFIDMPNAVQSELAITSTIDLKRGDSDYYAVLLMNSILGGDFSSYLNMNLREAHGWTYGARTSTAADRYVGDFSATTSVRNSVTDSAIYESMSEIQRIKSEMVDADKLEKSKAKYIGNFVLSLERPSTIARYALNIKTNKLPEDYYENYLKNISAVTVEDVKRVANKYLANDKMRIIVTGKGSDVVPTLDRLGYPINFFNKDGEQVEKPVFKREIPAGVTVETIKAAYIQALGGSDVVANVKSMSAVYEAKMGPNTLTQVSKKMAPNMVYSSMAMGTRVLQKQVFDGKTGYMEAQGQKMPMEGDELEKMKNSDILGLNEISKGKLVSFETFNEVDVYGIETAEGETQMFDVKTGLLVGQVSEMETPQGMMTSTVMFNNYEDYSGLKQPKSLTIIAPGAPGPLKLELQSMDVNKGVSKSDFK